MPRFKKYSPAKAHRKHHALYQQTKGSEVVEAQVAKPHQYSTVFYVQVYRLPDRSTCRTPLRACYHHIRIFADWSESENDGGITIRFQDVKRVKPKNHLLKVRMRNGIVYYIDFVHRIILKDFLDDCVAQQFLKDTPYTIKSVEVLNNFFLKPVYYPNGQSRFYS